MLTNEHCTNRGDLYNKKLVLVDYLDDDESSTLFSSTKPAQATAPSN